MIAFKCYKNLKTIIGMKRGENGEVKNSMLPPKQENTP